MAQEAFPFSTDGDVTIGTSWTDIPVAVRGAGGAVDNMQLGGRTPEITATLKNTGGSHGLSVGDVIEITGTANGWDGFFEVINDVNTTTFDVRWTSATGTNETSSSGSFTQRSSSSFSGGHVYYDDANSSLHRLEDYTQFGPVKT